MNFSFSRSLTVVQRCLYSHSRNMSILFDYIYWPLIDILLFGFIGVGFSSTDTPLLATLLTGLMLWQVAHRCSIEIARNTLVELWDENLVNFFATPLKLSEWMVGLMTMGLIGLLFTIPYAALLVYFTFSYNLFSLGFLLVPFIALLIMSGWILGFIAASCVIYWGQKIDIIVWAIDWLPTPFCSIYYPVEILPAWMQAISKCLPMTYVFEGMRFTIKTGATPYWYLGMSLLLNCIYLGIALSFFVYMFKKSKLQGLRTN